MGAILGGILGGWMFQHGGLSVVFLGCAGLAALWLAFAVTMREPPYVTSLRLPLSPEAIREAGLVELWEVEAEEKSDQPPAFEPWNEEPAGARSVDQLCKRIAAVIIAVPPPPPRPSRRAALSPPSPPPPAAPARRRLAPGHRGDPPRRRAPCRRR